jgi:hypothetical protein
MLAVFLGLPSALSAQGFLQTGIDALDVPVDARTVAMGESFVAVPENSMALMYNPAALFLASGARASYSQRTLDWSSLTSDIRYHAATAEVRIPQGTIGVLYNRQNLGSMEVSTASSPEGIGTLSVYNHMLAVGFATEVVDGLSAGAAVKAFDLVERTVQGTPPVTTFSGSYLFDLGLTYTMPCLTSRAAAIDRLSLGAAVQNFGTDLRVVSTNPRLEPPVDNVLIPLPRYLRVGFSYSLAVRPEPEEALTPLMLLATGEYRMLLNGPESMLDDRDYWGFGMEATFFSVFTARLGGFISPATNVYGVRGVPSLRYGLGLNLPLLRLGVDVPLTFRFDYAGIPVNPVTSLPVDRWTMHSWTLGVAYDTQIF